MKIRSLSVVLLAVAGLVATEVSAQAVPSSLSYTPSPTYWGTNGRVTQIVHVGNKVILGGSFDYIGPQTGYGVGVNQSVGTKLSGAPVVNGKVYAAVANGTGGWFIGGDFDRVGGLYRRHAAEIAANGTVMPWNPSPDGPVYALARTGVSVVIGGDFTTVNKASATRLASVDATGAGASTSGWSASANAPVRVLRPTATGLLVGGDFTTVDGQSHRGLARISATTGALSAAFRTTTNGSVRAIALTPDGKGVYLGGSFTAVGPAGAMHKRSRLAQIGTTSGTLWRWNPKASKRVTSLAVDPARGTVYAGGMFSKVRGLKRSYLAGIRPDGTVTGFMSRLHGCNTPHGTKYGHQDPPCTPEVDALTIRNGALFVGGRFSNVGAAMRHDAAAYWLKSLRLKAWNPVASNRPFVLAPSLRNLFIGGELTSVNGLVRRHLAALSATTGVGIASWQANTNNEVLAMQVNPSGTTVYVGGHFTAVRGVKRLRLAAVSTADGALRTGFHPSADNDVLSMGWGNKSLYVAGQFNHIGRVARSHVARLNRITGAVNPNFHANTVGPRGPLTAGGMVESIAVAPGGGKVFLGGPFNTVNKRLRPGVAVVNGLTGAMLANQLGGIARCNGYGRWVAHLYLSPDGKRLYGGGTCPDYIYQWDAVNLSTASNPTGLLWKTWCNAGMQGTLEVNGTFFFGSHGGTKGQGGFCWTSPSDNTKVLQQRYFEFNATSGALLPGHADFNSPMGVWSFASIPGGLLVGGDFTWVGSPDQVRQGLVLFPGTP